MHLKVYYAHHGCIYLITK